MKENQYKDNIFQLDKVTNFFNSDNSFEYIIDSSSRDFLCTSPFETIIKARVFALTWMNHVNFTTDNTVVTVKSIILSVRKYDTCERSVKVSYEILKQRKERIDDVLLKIIFTENETLYEVTFNFILISKSLAKFLRSGRNYDNYLDEQLQNIKGYYLSDNIYIAGECDRVVDGMRVDHIPAIQVIKIAMENLDSKPDDIKEINAKFNTYIDPRNEIIIESKIDNEALFLQNNGIAAQVSIK